MNIKNKFFKYIKNQGFIKYFKNTSLLLCEKIIRILLGLFVGVWVARYLGVEMYGLLNYCLVFLSFFSFFTTLGLDSGNAVKFLHDKKNDKSEVLGSIIFLKFFGGLLAFSLIALLIRLIENKPLTIFLVTVLSTQYLFQSANAFVLYFQEQVQSKYIVIPNLIVLILINILKIYLIINGYEVIYFAYTITLEFVLLSVFYVFVFYKFGQLKLSSIWFTRKMATKLVTISWPIMISAFLITIYMKIDIFMIKEMLGIKDVGYYSAALTISSAFYFIPTIITSSIFPALLKAKENSEPEYYKKLQTLFNSAVLFILPISIIIVVFSNAIIQLLYGEEYSTASSVLKIHILSTLFVFFNNIQMKWYITESLQKLALIRVFMATLINILLNWFFIPQYGIEGAAISTLISYAFSGYFGNIFFKKTRGIFKVQTKALFFYKW